MHIEEAKQLILDNMDFAKVLEYYGAKCISTSYTEVRSECVLHGGDNPSAFSYNIERGIWSCFSHGCGAGYNRDVFTFVKLAESKIHKKPCDTYRAVCILGQILGLDLGDIDTAYDPTVYDRLDNQRWAASQAVEEIDIQRLDESLLAEYTGITPIYAHQRGYDAQTLAEFEIGFAPKGLNEKIDSDFPGRVIVPIRHLDGSLVGLSGRLATDDLELEKKYGKYRHLYNFKKGVVLYNMNRALPYVQKTHSIVLTEGFFDVMRLWSFGIKNVVALMGCQPTSQQADMIAAYATNAYIALDGDKRGREGARRTYERLKGLCNVYIIPLPEGKDPDNLTFEEFWTYYAQAKKIG